LYATKQMIDETCNSSFDIAVNVTRQVPVLRIVKHHEKNPLSMLAWHMGMACIWSLINRLLKKNT